MGSVGQERVYIHNEKKGVRLTMYADDMEHSKYPIRKQNSGKNSVKLKDLFLKKSNTHRKTVFL